MFGKSGYSVSGSKQLGSRGGSSAALLQ